MRAITVYEANDGSRWDREDLAADRDKLCVSVEEIMARLPDRPDSFRGYYQRSRDDVLRVKTALLKLADRHGRISSFVDISDPSKVHTFGFAARVLSESDDVPISKAWWRLSCIDDAFREWEQPYYAIHPGTGEDICLNQATASAQTDAAPSSSRPQP